MSQDTVYCHNHGRRGGTVVCHHIFTMTGMGFYTPDPTDADPYPEAWCAECECILEEEGEWTNKALEFANFKLICTGCYPKAKASNIILRVH